MKKEVSTRPKCSGHRLETSPRRRGFLKRGLDLCRAALKQEAYLGDEFLLTLSYTPDHGRPPGVPEQQIQRSTGGEPGALQGKLASSNIEQVSQHTMYTKRAVPAGRIGISLGFEDSALSRCSAPARHSSPPDPKSSDSSRGYEAHHFEPHRACRLLTYSASDRNQIHMILLQLPVVCGRRGEAIVVRGRDGCRVDLCLSGLLRVLELGASGFGHGERRGVSEE